jgi:hypothetical protein
MRHPDQPKQPALTWLCHPTDFSVKTIMIWRPSKSFCWEKFLLLLVAFLLLVR